jgi:hypothetical protein
MANKILLLSNAQKTTLEAFPTYTETALPQLIASLTPGTFNVYRLSDVVTGTVVAAKTAAIWQATGNLQSTASSTINCNWPTHATNDVGILTEVFRGDATPDALAAGWTQLADYYSGSSTSRRRIRTSWKRAASAAEGSAAVGASAGGRCANITTFRGCITSGTPCELIGGVGYIAATTAISMATTFSVTQDKSIVMMMFAYATSNAGDPSLLSGGFTNADLTSITTRLDLVGANFATGLAIAVGSKALLGSLVASTATLTSAKIHATTTIAFYPA